MQGRRERIAAIIVIVLACLASCSGGDERRSAKERPPVGVKVFFAHQSVGEDLITGLREIGSLPAEESEGGWLAHTRVGENGDPIGKIAHFDELLRSGMGQHTEVALMKLCFVDSVVGEAPREIFAAYRQTAAELQRDYPDLVIAHATMPLTGIRPDPRGRIRTLLGLDRKELLANRGRNAFNDLMRAEYHGSGRLFDLALIESVRPNGRITTMSDEGGLVRLLAPEFSRDGGHLNAAGRRRVAEEFIHFIQSISGGTGGNTGNRE